MKALIELNHWDGPTEIIAVEANLEYFSFGVITYYGCWTRDSFGKDEYSYDFWRLPPAPGEWDGVENSYGMRFAKPERTLKESDIDWSDYESPAPWRNGVNKGGHRK